MEDCDCTPMELPSRCECNGMEFLSNRWVFTGECKHTREREVERRMQLLRKAYQDYHNRENQG